MIDKIKESFITSYCKDKKYTSSITQQNDYIRIDISNLREKIKLNLYKTGTVLIQGSPKLQLKREFEELKQKMEDDPNILKDLEKHKIKSCASKYNILLPEVRNKIKDSLASITNIELIIDPTPSEDYRAKLAKDKMSLFITQYKNGTLFLQGKEDSLFNETCDEIEKIATPSEQEVIIRFIAGNDEAIEKFSVLYTPKLTEQAEFELKNKIVDIYNFLTPHDLKWLVAAESLRIVNIPLPEFSPIIMPASKAFEGFIKKLLIEVGFYPANHFNSKTASFSYLNDKRHAERTKLEAVERHAGTYLDKISVCLDTNRNFMMHSDGSQITKIDQYEDASKKLDEIYEDMVKIFQYFKNAGFGI